MKQFNQIEKNTISVTSLTEGTEEKRYWFSRTPEERLQMTEILRQRNFGYDATNARLQRILTVAEFPQG